jgi:hypothetical protein
MEARVINQILKSRISKGISCVPSDDHRLPFDSSPNIIRMINSRRMTWAGHVAQMRETRNVYKIFVGEPEERDY